MKQTRILGKSASIAFLAVGAAIGAPSATPARASDDGSTMSAVLGVIGLGSSQNGEKIDYRERPKIVIPPNRQNLPAPRSSAESRPPSWPVDQENSHRQGARVANGGAGGPDEPARKTLTEPPEGFRRPTKDMSTWKDPSAKPSFWTNPVELAA